MQIHYSVVPPAAVSLSEAACALAGNEPLGVFPSSEFLDWVLMIRDLSSGVTGFFVFGFSSIVRHLKM